MIVDALDYSHGRLLAGLMPSPTTFTSIRVEILLQPPVMLALSKLPVALWLLLLSVQIVLPSSKLFRCFERADVLVV